MSDVSKGDDVRLQEDVLFGPIIPLVVSRVFKNGWLEAKSVDGRTWVKVRHVDVFPESEFSSARLVAWVEDVCGA